MAVPVVLFGSLPLYRTLGAFGVALLATWLNCARFALSTMFPFTAVSHFAPMRTDLIAMVPPALPRPALLVAVTGFLELAGAVGLLIEAARPWAAWGLIGILVVMFPANVKRSATRNKTSWTASFTFVDSGAHASAVCPLGLVGQMSPPVHAAQMCRKKMVSAHIPISGLLRSWRGG